MDGEIGYGHRLQDQIVFGDGISLGDRKRRGYGGTYGDGRNPQFAPKKVSVLEFEADMRSIREAAK